VTTVLEQQITPVNELLTLCQFQLNDSANLLNDCGNNYLSSLNYVYSIGNIFQNSRCVEDGLIFFCNAINFLCGNSSNSSSSLREECAQVRDEQCIAEWRVIENLINAPLPDCNSFDDGANLTVSDISVMSCPDGFDIFCGICHPKCGESFQFNDRLVAAFDTWAIVLWVINFTGGIITLIVSIKKRNNM